MDKSEHLSYVLRLWTVKSAGGICWRASLESPITCERMGFSNLEALFTYLEKVTQDESLTSSLPPDMENE